VERRDLARHPAAEHGAGHSVRVDPRARRATTAPRRDEVNDALAARKICRDFALPVP
jgi:hypothetical protein